MIDIEAISEIVSLYKKHGWTLRRVLLCDDSKRQIAAAHAKLFGEIEARTSEIDALWFSRSSKPDSETWELRHLGRTPFALLEVIDTDLGDDEREEILHKTELKIEEATRKLGASSH